MSLRQEACGIKINKLEREMLTNALRVLVNNLFLKKIMGKNKQLMF